MPVSAIDSRVFRNLFGTEEARAIFSDSAYVQCMINVEAALARAESKELVIPADAGVAITAQTSIEKIKLGNPQIDHIGKNLTDVPNR